MELDVLDKLTVLQQAMPGWKVQAGTVDWNGTPTVQVGDWGTTIGGELICVPSARTCFLGNPRNVRVNLRDFTEDQYNDLISLGIATGLARIVKPVLLHEKHNDIVVFLEPMDWDTAVQRWKKYITWVTKHCPGYPEKFYWHEALPENMVAWAARHFLGGIGISNALRKNLSNVKFSETGAAEWKDETYWSEFIFRTDDEARASLGWSGSLKWAINKTLSDKDSPVCHCSKVPDKWEEDDHVFHRLVKREKE